MSDLELCYLPATEALKRFQNKTLSPVEYLESLIKRAKSVEPTINAFTYKHYDEALELAKKAEAKYASGKRTRALEGLPIGIKDESNIKDKPTSNGSLILKDYVAESTSVNNARIMRAGGIVHARTATPEFSCAGYCHSRLWGVTRNPWNPAFTPGGSSGGSAASLSAGTSSIATGSDIGGSIRIPASACGLVGYKPPYGRNTDDPPFNLDMYCHTGPLARNVADTILLQNVLCGPHAKDISTLRPKLTLPTQYQPIKDWKIAYSKDLGFFEVDAQVEQNTLEALAVFKSLGATVEEVELGWTHDTLNAGMAYLEHLFGAYLSSLLEEHADDMTDYARAFAERGKNSKAVDFIKCLEVANKMYATLGPTLEKYNILVCPTNALAAVKADFNQETDTVQINGKTVNPMLGWVMTTPFNTLSRCPVISIPSGKTTDNVPTGIQIVGKTYQDKDVFRAAMAYETAAGEWFTQASNRPSI
ncbi:MAG: amidase [Arenicellales bacterium WSBS_2016_MAG_OTU3]